MVFKRTCSSWSLFASALESYRASSHQGSLCSLLTSSRGLEGRGCTSLVPCAIGMLHQIRRSTWFERSPFGLSKHLINNTKFAPCVLLSNKQFIPIYKIFTSRVPQPNLLMTLWFHSEEHQINRVCIILLFGHLKCKAILRFGILQYRELYVILDVGPQKTKKLKMVHPSTDCTYMWCLKEDEYTRGTREHVAIVTGSSFIPIDLPNWSKFPSFGNSSSNCIKYADCICFQLTICIHVREFYFVHAILHTGSCLHS